MGLEFSFDEISLDQQVSREQLEIDLYDELITISDAEPDEQVRLLAARPPVGPAAEDDKPESIRITGSLSKEQTPPSAAVTPGAAAGVRNEVPIVPPPPPNGAKPESAMNPAPGTAGGRPGVPVAAPPNGQNSEPVPIAIPSAQRTEMPPAPMRVQSQVPDPPANGQHSAPIPTRIPAAPSPPAATATTETSASACPDCGKPAGESDMICIECGAFIG